MLSKADSRKKIGEEASSGKLLHEIEAINKALYLDKTHRKSSIPTVSNRSKSTVQTHLFDPKSKLKGGSEDPLPKDKKSIWSWKGLKAFTNVRNRRFNCCFSLQVHSIEGLPPNFDGISLCIHWKRRDGGLVTRPAKVFQGIAEFEEQLTHTCSVYGSRSGSHHSAKYEAKHFLLYAAVVGAPELDLGKHRVDLTRLLPLTLEELEEEKSSAKWTTSFKLSGKAKGATLNVSFAYLVTGNNAPEAMSLKKNTASMGNSLVKFDQSGRRNTIQRAGSLPARSLSSPRSVEDIKDLHEVLPTSRSELSDSVSVLYQKFDEEKVATSVDYKPELDVFSELPEPLKQSSHLVSDTVEENAENLCEDSEFSVTEHGIELSSKEHMESEESTSKAADISEINNCGEIALKDDTKLHPQVDEFSSSGDKLVGSEERTSKAADISEIDNCVEIAHEDDTKLHPQVDEFSSNGDKLVGSEESTSKAADISEIDNCVERAHEDDTKLHPQVEEFSSSGGKLVGSDCISENNDLCTKDSLMVDLESALNSVSDLVIEGLESQEDENVIPAPQNDAEIQSNYKARRKGKSLSLDAVTESVACDFLDMLGIEHSPLGLSSESEPDSPRERLLRQFEKDTLAGGCSLFNFDIEDVEQIEFGYEVPTGSEWDTFAEEFKLSSMVQGAEEDSTVATGVARGKTRASVLEDLETEALMREYGLNEKSFQYSPRNSSGGFGSPIDIPPEEPLQLPPLGEGLGPFVQTKNGGFLRSMNPSLFNNAKSSGSLVMQVSSPVVVPAEMGSGIMDILQCLASVGIEKLSMQANKLMPLEDITGKTMQQIAWESGPSLEAPERQVLLRDESDTGQSTFCGQKKVLKGKSSGPRSNKFDSSSTGSGMDSEYVSLEDLAPLAMDKIEALSMEGLKIQSGMSEEDAPSNISTQPIDKSSALEGKRLNLGASLGLEGAGGLQLLDIKDSGDDGDGLMGLSLTLDEWMKLDSGEIDDEEQISEQTSKILAAHHANSMDLVRGRSKGEKKRGKGSSRKCGLFGNNFTVALMVQLRDPLRNYEPVGTPMLALIQVERVFLPPKPKIYGTVSEVRISNEEEDDESKPAKKVLTEEIKEEKILEEESVPQFKITEVHVAGLKTEPDKKKLWGSSSQQQSGSRWLVANGMGKSNKHPFMKSKAVAKSSSPAATTTKVQPGDTLWSISSRVHGNGAKWKELAALNPHIRNPNVIFPNETIRLR